MSHQTESRRVSRLRPAASTLSIRAVPARLGPRSRLPNGVGAATLRHFSWGDTRRVRVPRPETGRDRVQQGAGLQVVVIVELHAVPPFSVFLVHPDEVARPASKPSAIGVVVRSESDGFEFFEAPLGRGFFPGHSGMLTRRESAGNSQVLDWPERRWAPPAGGASAPRGPATDCPRASRRHHRRESPAGVDPRPCAAWPFPCGCPRVADPAAPHRAVPAEGSRVAPRPVTRRDRRRLSRLHGRPAPRPGVTILVTPGAV